MSNINRHPILDLVLDSDGSIDITMEFKRMLQSLNIEQDKEIIAELLCALAEEGMMHLCDILLQFGADVNATHDGKSPLMCAAMYGRPDTVNLLLRWGANRLLGHEDDTPLEYAKYKIDQLDKEYERYNECDFPQLTSQMCRTLQREVETRKNAYELIKRDLEGKVECRQLSDDGVHNSNTNIVGMNNTYRETNMESIMSNGTTGQIGTGTLPANAPLQCFDPIMLNEINITNELTTIYIMDENGGIQSVGCIDEDALQQYKSQTNYVFFRCKDAVRDSAFFISPDDVHAGAIRLLNLQMRIYVKDSQAQLMQPGKKYIVRPIEALGRIVEYEVVSKGEHANLVSATHCGPTDGSKLYEIQEVQSGGRRRRHTYRRMSRRSKRRGTRRSRR